MSKKWPPVVPGISGLTEKDAAERMSAGLGVTPDVSKSPVVVGDGRGYQSRAMKFGGVSLEKPTTPIRAGDGE